MSVQGLFGSKRLGIQGFRSVHNLYPYYFNVTDIGTYKDWYRTFISNCLVKIS